MAASLFSRPSAQRALLRRHLRSRRERLFQTWQQALAQADTHANDPGDLHTQLSELRDQVIAACLAEPFNPVFAEAIGTALATICVSRPEALGATQTVLSQELIAGVPDAGRAALQARVASQANSCWIMIHEGPRRHTKIHDPRRATEAHEVA